MTDKNYLQGRTKEELIIHIENTEWCEELLRRKLFLLTGCGYFGDSDGMNGSCVDCSIERTELWERCGYFQDACRKYNKRKYDEENGMV